MTQPQLFDRNPSQRPAGRSAAPLLTNANYHGAIDLWLEKHKRRTVFCFVQFGNVPLDGLPRFYLATPAELAAQKATAKGRGDTILYEEQCWTARAHAADTTDRIPVEWRFSPERVNQLLELT